VIKIRLFCAAGMSTSILSEKMKETARIRGIEVDIKAFPKSRLSRHLHGVDIVLLGPQIRHSFTSISKICKTEGVPVEIISNTDFGRMDGVKILEFALRIINNNKFFEENKFK
jgi:PTS system cellobiose-specific IIB component